MRPAKHLLSYQTSRCGPATNNRREGNADLDRARGGELSTTTTEMPKDVAASSALDKPTYQHYVLLMLFFGYVFNVIDRSSVLGAVLPSIKKEIAASNFQMGLLGGLAFSLFYSFLGVPLARLADRWSRVNVLALSIALWSAATATCGLAWNYISLFTSRVFTAVGEAGGSPPSHSLISDYFPRSKRGTALAVYAMSVPLGTSIGNALSGWLNVWFGWRMTFAIVGIPGVIFRGADVAHRQGAAARLFGRSRCETSSPGPAVLRRVQVLCSGATPSCTCRSPRRCIRSFGIRERSGTRASSFGRTASTRARPASYLAIFSLDRRHR